MGFQGFGPALSPRPSMVNQNILRPQAALVQGVVIEAPNALSIFQDSWVAGDAFPRLRMGATPVIQMGSGAVTPPATYERDRIQLRTGTDTQPRVLVDGTLTAPTIKFGAGGGVAPDTSISRLTDGRLGINANINGTIAQINTSSARTGPLFEVYAVDNATPGAFADAMSVVKVEGQRRPNPGDGGGHALGVTSLIGSNGTGVIGTCHGITSLQQIFTCGNANSEYTPLAVYQTDVTTVNEPRSWLTDFIQVGPVGQPDLQTGFTVCMNNHFNGAPADNGLSAAIEVVTQRWAPKWAHPASATNSDDRATYPIACGVHVTGSSNTNSIGGNERDGFSVGVRVGGRAHGWAQAGMRVGKAIEISDWRTHGIHVSGRFAGSTGPAVSVGAGFGEILSPNGVSTKVKAGSFSDSDFNNPTSGMIALSTDATPRLAVRVGTIWYHVNLTSGA